MLNVLCFECGGMYQVPYETKELTKQCPKCLIKAQKIATAKGEYKVLK